MAFCTYWETCPSLRSCRCEWEPQNLRGPHESKALGSGAAAWLCLQVPTQALLLYAQGYYCVDSEFCLSILVCLRKWKERRNWALFKMRDYMWKPGFLASFEQVVKSIEALLSWVAALSYSWVMDSSAITSNKQTVPRPCHSQNVLTSCLLHSYCLPGPIGICRSGKALLAVHQIPLSYTFYPT